MGNVDFNDLNQDAVGGEVETTESKKDLEKKLIAQYMKDKASDENLKDRVGIWKDYLELVHTCGYGKEGNLVQTKPANKTTGEKRELGYTATIVGYGFKNISTDVDMTYLTEVFSKNEEGEITSKIEEKTLKPGDTVFLTKKFTAIFLTRPEFSMEISNAKLIKVKLGENIDLETMLSKTLMRFNNKLTSAKVNDDLVKVSVSVVAGVKQKQKQDGSTINVNEYKVKPEYFEVFGGLDIPKSTKGNDPVEDKQKLGMEAAAHQVQKMVAASLSK